MAPYPAPDLLRVFIDSKKLTQAGAAEQLEIVPAALHQYLTRKQRPRADIQLRIAKWTGGQVPVAAWLTIEEQKSLDSVGAAVAAEPAPESSDSEPADPPKSGAAA